MFDLWPCAKHELVIYGLKDQTNEKVSMMVHQRPIEQSQLRSSALINLTNEKKAKPTAIVAPDVAQMTPFKVELRVSFILDNCNTQYQAFDFI